MVPTETLPSQFQHLCTVKYTFGPADRQAGLGAVDSGVIQSRNDPVLNDLSFQFGQGCRHSQHDLAYLPPSVLLGDP